MVIFLCVHPCIWCCFLPLFTVCGLFRVPQAPFSVLLRFTTLALHANLSFSDKEKKKKAEKAPAVGLCQLVSLNKFSFYFQGGGGDWGEGEGGRREWCQLLILQIFIYA